MTDYVIGDRIQPEPFRCWDYGYGQSWPQPWTYPTPDLEKEQLKKENEQLKKLNKILADSVKNKNVQATTKNVVFILDSSGSMNSIKSTVLEQVNDRIREIKSLGLSSEQKVKVTFTKFSNSPTVLFMNEPTETLEEISNHSYSCSGNTALNDAIGLTLDRLGFRTPDETFMVYVITDGEENASKNYSQGKIKEMIEEREATGRFTFSYIGTESLDLIEKNYAIRACNSVCYTPTHEGTRRSFGAVGQSLCAYLGN